MDRIYMIVISLILAVVMLTVIIYVAVSVSQVGEVSPWVRVADTIAKVFGV